MITLKADILNSVKPYNVTVILHGCNCFSDMGGGIARYLADTFPIIETRDNIFHSYGDESKLGKIEPILIHDSMDLIVVNCYTQFFPGSDVNYEAIRECLKNVSDFCESFDCPVEIRAPKIGCGIAGGDWNTVEKIFEEELPETIIYEL